MTTRRWILTAGAVLLLVGVIGLLTPVSMSDNNGGTVACGNGLAPDRSAAAAANDRNGANIPVLNQIIPHTDFVAECQSAVSSRRMWTIPLVVLGVLGATGGLVARRGSERAER